MPDRTSPPGISAARAVLAALLGLVAAVASGQLVAGLVGAGASPVTATGDAVIDLAPAWLTEIAIAAFGEQSKLVLRIAVLVVAAGVAVLAGMVSRRGAVPGMVVAAGLGVLAVLAVLTRDDVGRLAVLAPLAGLLAGLGVFRWLHGVALGDGGGPAGEPGSRRGFLRAALGVVLGAGASGGVGALLTARGGTDRDQVDLGRLRVAKPAPPIPRGADFAGAGTPTFRTANRDFYRVDTAFVVPRLSTDDWSLRVHGMVDRELTLSFDDLRRRGLHEHTITMVCVSNQVGGPYLSTATFLGVPIADLLAEAGVRPEAEQLLSTSADGFTAGTEIGPLTDRGRAALLAIGMNGEPLPAEHGFPARMVVPGLYGYVSATKWVTDMELTTWRARRAYWLERGWARTAPVKTQSRIDAPAESATVAAGTVVVAGTAWAPPHGIRRVEVRLDDGPWRPAELAAATGGDTWRMWRIALEAQAGDHRVQCRATDATGERQTARRAPPAPDGATGWHAVRFTAE